MVQCVYEEPIPPSDPEDFEEWCASGKSGRPIQTHIGDYGAVLWVNDEDSSVVVRFDDGDERVLHRDEIAIIWPFLSWIV